MKKQCLPLLICSVVLILFSCKRKEEEVPDHTLKYTGKYTFITYTAMDSARVSIKDTSLYEGYIRIKDSSVFSKHTGFVEVNYMPGRTFWVEVFADGSITRSQDDGYTRSGRFKGENALHMELFYLINNGYGQKRYDIYGERIP